MGGTDGYDWDRLCSPYRSMHFSHNGFGLPNRSTDTTGKVLRTDKGNASSTEATDNASEAPRTWQRQAKSRTGVSSIDWGESFAKLSWDDRYKGESNPSLIPRWYPSKF